MELPLVTICIISFNSELYIAECIESCLAQTYTNVEIVVADDASTDRTPDIIQEYIQRYPKKIRAVLAQINEGVAPNFNRAVKVAKGDWLKTIACDDVLMPDCIEQYMNAVNRRMIQSGILFGRMQSFGPSIAFEEVSDVPAFFAMSDTQRLQSLTLMNTLPAPTAFFNVRTLHELCLANEQYPFLEDHPLWVKAVCAGVYMDCIDGVTVKYRVHESLSNSFSKIGNEKYYISLLNFTRDVLCDKRKGIDKLKNIDDFVELNRIILSIRIFSNKKNFLFYLLSTLTKPFKPYSAVIHLMKIFQTYKLNK